jgi:RimJ/RimL family protein N-acetyltransferase
MLSPRLDSLGVRPLEPEDATELHALVEANRAHLARWMPWAAEQDRDGTERFLAEAEAQFARDDGFQARIAPEGEIVGVAGFHSRAIPECFGFREEARLRETELVGGSYLDSVVYGLLEEEWRSSFE